MNNLNLQFHPASQAFPLMERQRYEELKDDIARQGLIEPIMLFEGMILDGRNRYRACQELGIEPKFRHYNGDPWAYVWSLNGQRRDLVAEQRYLIWKYCHGQSEAWQTEKRRIQEEADRKRSKAMQGLPYAPKGEERKPEKVLPQSVVTPSGHRKGEKARATLAQVNRGAVARGERLAKARSDLAEKVRLGEMKPAEAHRLMKRDEVSQKVASLPEGKFTVIYADPPWKYSDSRGELPYGPAESHYPTLPLSELKALNVPALAAPDSVLFLWTPSPLLPEGLELALAWGFKYKASFVWYKVKHNYGHYNSVRHEYLLVCTRGSCTPESSKLFNSVQTIERSDRHSEKPGEFRRIIETLYPSGKRIELFRRGRALDGWLVWGNEVE
jgi:N6-adenosine-specific RNA methylase IME4